MPAHRFYQPDQNPAPREPLEIQGPEAHHAISVKRLRTGEAVEVLDGRGTIASGTVAAINKHKRDPRLILTIDAIRTIPPIVPRVAVCSPAPTGDRAVGMIDQLAQVGVAGWQPLACARAASAPAPSRRLGERMAAACVSACKQSGRAWLMALGEPIDLDRALQPDPSEPAQQIILADATGQPMPSQTAESVRVLVGPAGGWTNAELDRAREASVTIARLTPHVLRLETACVVASAGVLLHTLSAPG